MYWNEPAHISRALSDRRRIMYVETAVGRGGAVISLLELVGNLDRSQYEPIVLFKHPNKFRERFEARGIRTLVTGSASRASADGSEEVSRRHNSESLPGPPQIKAALRSVRQLQRLIWYDLPSAQSISHIIKAEQVDLVHSNGTPFGNRDAVIGAKLAQVPQVCHVRIFRDFTWTEFVMSHLADHLIFTSSALQNSYHKYKVDSSRKHTINNPIDTAGFMKEVTTYALYREFGISKDDFVISNIARLDWWKGHEYFLKSLRQLKNDGCKFKSLIVGAGDNKAINLAYVQNIRELVGDLGLENQVIFTGHRDDIPEIMAVSDVVVHSASSPEPFGRVIAEAMAAGRPVIATAAGGPLEIIDDGVTGLLVPLRNVEAMSKAILWVLTHPDQAAEMGRKARISVAERYSIQQHVSAVQAIYDKMLSKKVSDI